MVWKMGGGVPYFNQLDCYTKVFTLCEQLCEDHQSVDSSVKRKNR